MSDNPNELFGVKLTEPKRSDTLKQYMSNMDYTDNDIIHEDDNGIVFNSRYDRDEYHQNDYDKKTDTYDTTGVPGSAAQYNSDYNKRIGVHNSYLSKLNKDIADEDECIYHYNKLILDYADGIMKRSGNNMDPEKAKNIALKNIGSFREFKKSVLNHNNRK